MASIFDPIPTVYEPDIQDKKLQMLVWHCNMNGHLATDVPKASRPATIAEAETFTESSKSGQA